MRTIKAKLRSRRGASITFALLLFLVCAIISGVVIVAASTVGGRMSGLRETDQRYYGATEAARKLKGIFDNQTVTVSYDPSDLEAEPTAPDGINTILAKASAVVVKSALNKSNVEQAVLPQDLSVTNGTYTCTITPTLKNGLLNCAILVTGPSDNLKTNGTYKLIIAFTPNLKMPEAGSAASGTATVTWTLNSLSKGRATATVSGG